MSPVAVQTAPLQPDHDATTRTLRAVGGAVTVGRTGRFRQVALNVPKSAELGGVSCLTGCVRVPYDAPIGEPPRRTTTGERTGTMKTTPTKQALHYRVVRNGIILRIEQTLGDAQEYAFNFGGTVKVVFTDGTTQEV